MNSYKTIHKYGEDKIVINKSEFISHASFVTSEEDAIEFIEEIRKKHKDASHNVYGYIIGEKMNLQRFSDDKEPSGTAGMPVLNVIKLEKLCNVVVVVTRYFGGIKLGAGGLVRAYTKGAKLALDSGIIVEKIIYKDILIEIDYNMLGKVENELSKNLYIIKDKSFGQSVIITVLCVNDGIEDLIILINDITSAKSKITIDKADYYSIKDGKILY